MHREQELVRRARQGDEGAFAALVEENQRRIYQLALRMTGNPEDAAELSQEAFLHAWRGLARFQGESSFSTWLYRLASNACVDQLRREGKRQGAVSLDDEDVNLEIPASIPSPQEEAERRELREQIEEGLRALPPEYRAALVLREMQQLRYDEIGQALGLDIGTVKSRISRGRKKLRSFLLERGNFSPPPPSKETGKGGRS